MTYVYWLCTECATVLMGATDEVLEFRVELHELAEHGITPVVAA